LAEPVHPSTRLWPIVVHVGTFAHKKGRGRQVVLNDEGDKRDLGSRITELETCLRTLEAK